MLFLFSRLHDSSEKILDSGSDKESKLRRKRRHQLRIFLLVVDYLIESLGSICIFVVVFVADESLWQHHLLITAGSFLYGVPIALSYLLSETRVRIIIIENGWFQGITSIFQSSEKIKQLKSNKIVECWHDKGLLACPNKQNINISETNKTDLQNKNSEVSKDNPILKDIHEIHVPHNIENVQIENTFASKNLSYDRAISKTNTSSLPTTASNVNLLKPTSKDNHQVQLEYNIKNGIIQTALISKSVSYDCAIHPTLTNYSETSHNVHHKRASDTQLHIKDIGLYKSASHNVFIYPSTKKYRHISIDAQYNHADEVHANTFLIDNVRQDSGVVPCARPRLSTITDLIANRTNEESSRKRVNVDVEMADQLCNVEYPKASIEMISRMDVDLTVNEIKPLSRVDNNIDYIHSIDRIVVDSDAEISKRFPSVKGKTETIESKPLMDINAVLINSVFVEQSNKVMSILSDKDFKVFSRSYILNRTIKLLDNDKNESDYQKYFHYICDLECFPECDHDNDKKLHFLVSLINVWLLNKYQNSFECEKNVVTNEIHMSESINHNDIGGGCLSYERTRILNLMLCNVRNDPKYIKLLEHLYIQEDEQKEDELVYGW